MDNKTNLLLLLQIIKAGGSVEALVNRGLRFSQIGEIISYAEGEGLVFYDENNFTITDKGKAFIQKDNVTGIMRKDGGWISAEEESRTTKINKFEPYLPSIKCSFLKK